MHIAQDCWWPQPLLFDGFTDYSDHEDKLIDYLAMPRSAQLPGRQDVRWFHGWQEPQFDLPCLLSGVVPTARPCLFDVIPRRTKT